ncbi:nectin-1-like isoform X3 [Pelobates cultripes]|uniref:Nectin-1-like isoform X3 n=1 Tax=Pelobates cultripes TaxID=61616 RepID=A0AAD1VLJ5_PELCU|nr:nectin-1-like isoform X3 [Pelobates cultripes]
MQCIYPTIQENVVFLAMRILILWLLQTLSAEFTLSQVSVHVEGDVQAVLYSDVVLRCRVETQEHVTQLTWQKKKTPNNEDFLTYSKGELPVYLTPFAQERVKFLGGGDQSGNILIRNVTLNDEGIYLCSFSTHPTGTREKEIKLTVQVYPEILVGPSMNPVTVGDSPQMMGYCIAIAAKPAANIQWIIKGFSYSLDKNTTRHENLTVTTMSYLMIPPSLELYGHNVTCVITQENVQQQQERMFNIRNIHYAPLNVNIRVIPSEEQMLQLSCEYDSNPPASKFTWRWDSNSESGSQYIPENSNQLTIPNDNVSSGLCVCEVENPVGSKSGSIYIYTKKESPNSSCIRLVFPTLSILVFGVAVAVLLYHFWKKKKAKRESTDLIAMHSNTSEEDKGSGCSKPNLEPALENDWSTVRVYT